MLWRFWVLLGVSLVCCGCDGTTAGSGKSAATTGGASAGGSAQAGTTSGGGRTAAGGKTNATDDIGQNPFDRSPSDGILVTSSDGLDSTALVIAADSQDNLLIAGATRNPEAMGLTAFDAGIVSEAFAAKLNSQAKLVWTVPIKSCGVPSRIAAGPDDSAYVLCPNEPDSTTLTPSTCDAAAVVTQLASNDGHVIYQTAVTVPSAPAGAYWCPYALAVDTQGGIYVGGDYTSTFPTGQALVIGLSSSGQQQWASISTGPSDPNIGADSYAQDLAIDSAGNVLVCGSFNNWMTLGSTRLDSQAMLDQYSSYNGFVGRMSSTGTNATSWRFGGAVFDLGMAVEPASDGGFYAGGSISSTAIVGGLTVNGSANGSAFVARFDASGTAAWAAVVPDKSKANDLAVDAAGTVHFVGSFSGSELFYSYDPTTSKLTSRSTASGSNSANSLQTDSIAITTSGAIWITGTFVGTIDLGGGSLTTSTVAAFLWRAN